MENNHATLKEDLLEWKIELSEEQYQQLDIYYHLLVEKNKVMNLTAITEYEEVLKKHFLDSLSLINVLPQLSKNQGEGLYLLDMGTGAGFPSLPLKIAFPKLRVTMMDSLNKRILFLQDVIRELKLSDIEAIHGRAEEAARKEEYREQYDICVSRAVARLVSLSEFCLPFVKKGGFFIPYKSGSVKEELEEASFAIQKLGGKYKLEKDFILPNSDIQRSLLVIEKLAATPAQYPRGGGKPLKQPLISAKKGK